MSNERPYYGYEPNEPEPAQATDHARKPLAPASPLTRVDPYRVSEPAGNAPARAEAPQPRDNPPPAAASWPTAQPAVSKVWDLENYLPNVYRSTVFNG